MIAAVMPTYARPDIAFERGEGSYLFATDGRRYLDFMAGIAVVAMGHSHPHLVQALQEQAARLWHTSNLYRIPGQEQLAARLVEATFADTVFFTNSGVEAWECGVKLCRKYQSTIGQPKRWRVITVGGAFHGRTLAAIAAARSEKMLKGFGPMVDGFDQVAFGNLNELRMAITDETAAICVEPILGEGGVRHPGLDYLTSLRRIADEFGLLLYFDEIQTGYGRTGRLFAHEWAVVAPDVMCVAKGIGGGFPLGACLATERAAIGMVPGSHGSTYGGNPLAMAVGNAMLDLVLAPGFLEQVQKTGAQLWRRLSDLVSAYPETFEELRGQGLLLGLKCRPPNTEIVDALRAAGLLVAPAADNVIRILPALTLSEAQAEEGVGILRELCAARAMANPPPRVAHG